MDQSANNRFVKDRSSLVRDLAYPKWIPPDYYEVPDKESKSKEKNNEIFHFILLLFAWNRRNNQRMKKT
jgi:hypothetical protein